MRGWITTDPLLSLAPGGLHQVDGVAGNPGMAPLRLPGLVAWWDACRPGALESGDRVSSWPDMSGHGWALAQTTDSARPTWVDVQRNGMPVLRFDGADYLYLAQASGPTMNLQGITVLLVLTVTSHRNYAGYLSLCPASGNDYQTASGAAIAAQTQAQSLNCTINGQAVAVNLSTAAGWNIYTVVVDGRAKSLLSLGSPIGSAGPHNLPSESAQVGILIGARFLSGAPTTASNYGLAGAVGEVLIYNSVLSPLRQAEVIAYLGRKWGFTR